MVGEDGGDAEEARVEHGLVRQGGEGGMTVDDRDSLAQQNVADQRQRSQYRRQNGLVVEWLDRQVVDLRKK